MSEIRQAQSGAVSSAIGDRVRVLVVAEQGEFAEALTSRLKHAGCAVDLVPPGEGGRAAEGSYHLVLIDLEPSATDALGLLRLVGAVTGSGTPVVLIAAAAEPAHVVQRGLDLGAAGYLVKEELPATLDPVGLIEGFGVGAAPGAPNDGVGVDSCSYSARGAFHECVAFMPLKALASSDAAPQRVSCSHLRSGAAGAWRLYPRCALGDPPARARYARDQAAG